MGQKWLSYMDFFDANCQGLSAKPSPGMQAPGCPLRLERKRPTVFREDATGGHDGAACDSEKRFLLLYPRTASS